MGAILHPQGPEHLKLWSFTDVQGVQRIPDKVHRRAHVDSQAIQAASQLLVVALDCGGLDPQVAACALGARDLLRQGSILRRDRRVLLLLCLESGLVLGQPPGHSRLVLPMELFQLSSKGIHLRMHGLEDLVGLVQVLREGFCSRGIEFRTHLEECWSLGPSLRRSWQRPLTHGTREETELLRLVEQSGLNPFQVDDGLLKVLVK
mmetsp:Transcript_14970/g.32913  ORF Transcript_14970/g.32913 Transcript_14970/m.32913 type:complete len:205 (-) Transcript_14970:942-1556(-)